MTTYTLPNGKRIRCFADIDEFPAERRSWFTRYQIENAELDLTPQAMAQRMGVIMLANNEGRTADVAVHLQNLYLSVVAATEFYAPDALTLGVIIHDVDGTLVTDFSPEGLLNMLAELEIPGGLVREISDELKKNFERVETFTSLGLATT